MSKALSRVLHLSQTGAGIRVFPYQYGTIRSRSSGKLDPTIVTKINKDLKEIYEFLRRPELHKGDLKFKKDDHSGIAYITLDFPQKRNAMSGASFKFYNFKLVKLHHSTKILFIDSYPLIVINLLS